MTLLSPVLRSMICGQFKESSDRILVLDDVDKEHFVKLLQLGCGEAINVVDQLEALHLALLSDGLRMDAVTAVLEDSLVQKLNSEICVEILARVEASGLNRLQDACYQMAHKHFVAILKTDAFFQLSEETMERLLEEDELGTLREEDVFEAAVRWMTRDSKKNHLRGGGLLFKIRFGVVGEVYLAESMMGALPGHDGLKQLVAEALAKKGSQAQESTWDGVERLCEKWVVPRGRILGKGILRCPIFVEIDRQARILVSDFELHQIVVFNHDGSVAQRIGSKGKGEGQFDMPEGIAVDQQGNIFVADRGNYRIQVFKADGSFVRSIRQHSNGEGQLWDPHGVAIDMEGRLVVADHQNHMIHVFSSDGLVASTFGSKGNDAGRLYIPFGVVADGAGRIVVCESGNGRVQIFSPDRSVALCFGKYGTEPGRFSCPMGVAVDREGRLIVADSGNHRVQVFNADGSVCRVFGKKGSGVGEFRSPVGVAVDGDGHIWVADRDNRRVQVL